MATILSNHRGMVVKAEDDAGTYYYLADGMGTPMLGGWTRKRDAVACLKGWKCADPNVNLDARGRRETD